MSIWHPDMPQEFRNQVVLGDCRELGKRIPDESIDAIFTDPPYPKEYLWTYEWLAETAARVLKPGGLCLAMCGQSYLPTIYEMMGKHLTYHWTICLDLIGPRCNIWQRKVGSNWKPIVSFSKGAYEGKFVCDFVRSTGRDKRFHRWGQNISEAVKIVGQLNAPVFLEPFSGGGTATLACKLLGRNYVAFDNDPEAVKASTKRLAEAEPLLERKPRATRLFDEPKGDKDDE